MPAWTSEDIAKVLKGELRGDGRSPVAGCVLDSRQAQGGEIFFALPGEKADGHRFIRSAWDNGAQLAVAAKNKIGEFPDVLEVPQGKALVLVDSPVDALRALAKAWRHELGAKVVGITGSNGKTTTKDMVAAVLEQGYRVYKNTGNHNNELGLPMTILNAPEGTEILVLEMGMRGLGEIKALCEIAQPDTGLITNIGTTHLELLGTQERIAQAKWELIDSLPPQGTAVLNAEDSWSVAKGKQDPHSRIFYGLEGKWARPEVAGSGLQPWGLLGTTFSVRRGEEEAEVLLPLPGEHNVLDALAALAVGSLYGVSLADGCRGLKDLKLSKLRLEVFEGYRGSVLISDVYNANPVSMQASLRVLKERAGDRDTLAILGEMYELGPESESGHRTVGETAAALGISELITVGAMAEDIARGALAAGFPAGKVHTCATREEGIKFAQAALSRLKQPAWVLIKGSRGMKMEEVTAGLKREQISKRNG